MRIEQASRTCWRAAARLRRRLARLTAPAARQTALHALLIGLFTGWSQSAAGQLCNDGLACEVEARGDGGVELDIGAGIPILTGFELEYLGGDRHVRSMTVGLLPERPSRFQLRLQDNDGSAAVRGWARYFRYGRVLRSMRERTSTSADGPVMSLRSVSRRGCRGSCRVEIPGFDKTRYHFFLSGFRFAFQGDDRHLRRFRIWPTGDIAGASGVWTTFRDNSEDHSYDVTLSYVLLPADHSDEGVLYGGVGSRTDDTGSVLFPRPNLSGRAMNGVGAGYADDDEHVRVVGARVDRRGGKVTLRDNDAREDIFPFIASRRLPVE